MKLSQKLCGVAVICGFFLAACGGGSGSGEALPGENVMLSLVAGTTKRPSSEDGSGSAARFNQPRGVVVDAAGNAYVADTGNHVIRKVTPGGVVTTLAGTAGQAAWADGVGSAARFSLPSELAIGATGNIYVSDTGNNKVRVIAPNGAVSTLANLPAPTAIAVDAQGVVFVTSQYAIFKVLPSGATSVFLGTPGAVGVLAGDTSQTLFGDVRALAVDKSGILYVAEKQVMRPPENHTLRRFDSQGKILHWPGATASQVTLGVIAPLTSIAVDSAGDVIGVASGFRALFSGSAQRFNHIVRINEAGAMTTLAGSEVYIGSNDGVGSQATFYNPYGIGINDSGRLVVTDSGNQAVRQIDAAGAVTTLAGGMDYGDVDGSPADARFGGLSSIAVGDDETVFVVDSLTQHLRRIDANGTVSTSQTPDTNGVPYNFSVLSVARGEAGSLFFRDPYHAPTRIEPRFSSVYRYAGKGPATALQLNADYMATDPDGQLFVSNPSGVLAVQKDGSTRKIVNAAPLVAADRGGVLYFTSGASVYALNGDGQKVFTVGSSANAGYRDGKDADALLKEPLLVAADGKGTIYIADGNNTIRKRTSDGTVTTIAGVAGRSDWKLGPALAPLGAVKGLAWSGSALYATVDNAALKIGPLP